MAAQHGGINKPVQSTAVLANGKILITNKMHAPGTNITICALIAWSGINKSRPWHDMMEMSQ